MKPTIICITPVKNEAWILDRFLSSASLWADYIIIADQMSTDGSRDIALKYPKVILIDNSSTDFNEKERNNLLLIEARKISGKRLIIALDADEIFSPEIFSSNDWKSILNLEFGTVIKFQWANLKPGLKKMWLDDFLFPWGYIDDGGISSDDRIIHTSRIPYKESSPIYVVKDFKVMHFQYTVWSRMQCKHRWYQCYERVKFPKKSAVDIYRLYHHMYSVSKDRLIDVPTYWQKDYLKQGIDISKGLIQDKLWWEESVLEMFDNYSIHTFSSLNIWGVNWNKIAKKWNRANSDKYKDPRGVKDILIQLYLKLTQRIHQTVLIRKIDNRIKLHFKY